MKFIRQFLYILVFTLLGELLQNIIPLPIPAAIYGIILLFIALLTGILKEEKVAETAQFLISLLPLLFVAPAVSILQHWHLIAPNVGTILLITVVSTYVVFTVSGLVTKKLLKHKEEDNHD